MDLGRGRDLGRKNLINVQECGLAVGALDISTWRTCHADVGTRYEPEPPSRGGRRGWCRLTYWGRRPPLCPAFGCTSRCHSDSPLSAGCMLGPGSRSSECPSNSLDRGCVRYPPRMRTLVRDRTGLSLLPTRLSPAVSHSDPPTQAAL